MATMVGSAYHYLSSPEEYLEHEKFERTTHDGREVVIIRCPYCHTDTTTGYSTLAWYGKSCSGCGAKHLFFGLTRKPTVKQQAWAASHQVERPKPRGRGTSTRRRATRRPAKVVTP